MNLTIKRTLAYYAFAAMTEGSKLRNLTYYNNITIEKLNLT